MAEFRNYLNQTKLGNIICETVFYPRPDLSSRIALKWDVKRHLYFPKIGTLILVRFLS